MSRCEDCPLHKGCRNSLIMGRGSHSKKTKVMVILDAPSYQDDRFNQCLSGDTRAKLSYLFEQTGFNPDEVYVTYAVKCSVKAISDIKKKHLVECRKYLFNEIIEHSPLVIIAMGKWSWTSVSNYTSVREFRGHFDDFELDREVKIRNKIVIKTFKCKIMPTFSLLASLSKWEYDIDIVRDFTKVVKYLRTNTIDITKPVDTNVILTVSGLNDFVEKMRSVKYCTTDYETTGFNFWEDRIINAGYFSHDVADIIYLEPYRKEHLKKWDKENIDRARQINIFLKYNRDKCVSSMKLVNSFDNIKFILHNGKFDAKFALFNEMPYKNFWFDTLRADPLIDENVGHALNIACERRNINFGPYDTLLWPYVNKDSNKQKSYQFIPPKMLEHYLGIDVYADHLLWKKQMKELKKEDLYEFFFKNSMPALLDILKTEYIGVKYHKKMILKASNIVSAKQDQLLTSIKDLTNLPEFNPNSPKQVIEYMTEEGYPFERLKIKENKTGYSTGKDELNKFLKYKKWNKFPKLLLDIKKLTKIRGTYIDGKDGNGGFLQYLDENNRIHANFNLWTPRTGSYSCSKPSLQVFPRPIKGLPNTRSFVIPTNRDWMLFEADYSQLEQCIVAALSKDKILTKRIQDGMDLHCINATDLGKILNVIPKWVSYEHMLVANEKEKLVKDQDTINEIMKDIEKHGKDIDFHEIRTQAKGIGFGLNYGKTPMTFAKDFKIAEDEAEDMVDAYFEIYSGMYDWRNKLVNEAVSKGFITLLSGRKRRFNAATNWINNEYSEDMWKANNLKEEISRQAMNFPVQGGAHEVFESACIRLNKHFRKHKMKSRILLSIHDGIVGECPKDEREAVNQALLKQMPHTFHRGTKYELNLKIDTDFYEYEWYGKKLK